MKDCFDIAGLAAVITGVSTGIGLQMAKAFASQGTGLVFL